MDAIELLEHDHRIVEQLFRDYRAAASDERRRGVVEILIREPSKHAALEELTVHPLVRRLCRGRRLRGMSDGNRVWPRQERFFGGLGRRHGTDQDR